MNSLIRTVVVALVMGLFSLGIIGLRFACSPGDHQGFLRESRRREELRELQRATSHRIDSQQEAVQELIDGRCTLAEVLQRFQELDREFGQEWPDYSSVVPKKWPVVDEERHYRYIRVYVKTILHGRTEELAPVLRRLEKDYLQFQTDRRMLSNPEPEQKKRSR